MNELIEENKTLLNDLCFERNLNQILDNIRNYSLVLINSCKCETNLDLKHILNELNTDLQTFKTNKVLIKCQFNESLNESNCNSMQTVFQLNHCNTSEEIIEGKVSSLKRRRSSAQVLTNTEDIGCESIDGHLKTKRCLGVTEGLDNGLDTSSDNSRDCMRNVNPIDIKQELIEEYIDLKSVEVKQELIDERSKQLAINNEIDIKATESGDKSGVNSSFRLITELLTEKGVKSEDLSEKSCESNCNSNLLSISDQNINTIYELSEQLAIDEINECNNCGKRFRNSKYLSNHSQYCRQKRCQTIQSIAKKSQKKVENKKHKSFVAQKMNYKYQCFQKGCRFQSRDEREWTEHQSQHLSTSDKTSAESVATNDKSVKNSEEIVDSNQLFDCFECKLKFTTKLSLNIHVLSHKSIGRFVCDYKRCDKRFGQLSDLTEHKQWHKCPFKCHFRGCSAQFDKDCHLSNHLKNVHKIE